MRNYDDVYWGYLFLDKQGNFKTILKKESTPLIRELKQIIDVAITTFHTFMLPRRWTSYQGMISWEQRVEEVYIFGMKTHKNSSLKNYLKLHSELERLAKNMHVFNIRAHTHISPEIMKRYGWKALECDEKDKYKPYSKKLF